jgi:hypothetical protein
MSGNDSVRAYLFIFVSICITIEDPVINQLGLGSITSTGLTPPHVCACHKPPIATKEVLIEISGKCPDAC